MDISPYRSCELQASNKSLAPWTAPKASWWRMFSVWLGAYFLTFQQSISYRWKKRQSREWARKAAKNNNGSWYVSGDESVLVLPFTGVYSHSNIVEISTSTIQQRYPALPPKQASTPTSVPE